MFAPWVNDQPLSLLKRSGLLHRIGGQRVFDEFDQALAAARAGTQAN
jgi:hypothetical protein